MRCCGPNITATSRLCCLGCNGGGLNAAKRLCVTPAEVRFEELERAEGLWAQRTAVHERDWGSVGVSVALTGSARSERCSRRRSERVRPRAWLRSGSCCGRQQQVGLALQAAARAHLCAQRLELVLCARLRSTRSVRVGGQLVGLARQLRLHSHHVAAGELQGADELRDGLVAEQGDSRGRKPCKHNLREERLQCCDDARVPGRQRAESGHVEARQRADIERWGTLLEVICFQSCN